MALFLADQVLHVFVIFLADAFDQLAAEHDGIRREDLETERRVHLARNARQKTPSDRGRGAAPHTIVANPRTFTT